MTKEEKSLLVTNKRQHGRDRGIRRLVPHALRHAANHSPFGEKPESATETKPSHATNHCVAQAIARCVTKFLYYPLAPPGRGDA